MSASGHAEAGGDLLVGGLPAVARRLGRKARRHGRRAHRVRPAPNARLDGVAVGREPLRRREAADGLPDRGQAASRRSAGPGCTARTPRRQRVAGTSEPAGREDVVGAGRVVTGGLGRPGPDEDRSGMADPTGDARRRPGRRREVLRRVGVDERDGGREVRRERDPAVGREGGRARISRRSRRGSRVAISRSTASARAGLVVTRIAGESGPCSAWVTRSAATMTGSAASSARTIPSDGPAGRSIPTRPATSSFAAVTQALPGPTIRSTGSNAGVARRGVGVPTERERSDRLGAAGDEDGIDLEQPGGAEQHRVDRPRPASAGVATTTSVTPAVLGRDDGHDERRRVRRGPARDVAADAVERQPATLDLDAGHDRRPTSSLDAASRRTAPDVVDRLLERRAIGAGRAGRGPPAAPGGRR